MRTTQSKFLKTVENTAAEFGCEAVADFDFSNRGRVVVHAEEGSLEQVLAFDFDFQNSSYDGRGAATFKGLPGEPDARADAASSFRGQETFPYDRLYEVVKRVRNALAQRVLEENQRWLESHGKLQVLPETPGDLVRELWDSLVPRDG